MKKIVFYISTAIAVLALLFACTKAEEREDVTTDNPIEEPAIVEQGDGVYSLTISSPTTKTVFGDKVGTSYAKYWVAGDQIRVNGVESLPLEADGAGAGTSTATFRFSSNININAGKYYVVYPSSAYNTETQKVTIPAAQSAATGKFDPAADIILGYGDNPASITLTNAVAYLKIKLTQGDYGNFGVSSISVTANDKMLNGAYAIAAGGEELTVPDASSNDAQETVTLTVTDEPTLTGEAKEFLIAVAPQTLDSGFTVTITDKKGNTMNKTKASSATLAAGGILAQPAFPFQEYQAIDSPEDLLAFASAAAGNTNYWLVTNNINMSGKAWDTACGTGDKSSSAFNGVFDGGNNGTEDGGWKISNLNSTTGAFINFVYSSGTVKNVTLASGSISCSSASEGYICVGMVGMSRGIISHCYNRATVSSSVVSSGNSTYIGGIVGRVYRNGNTEYCYNYADVSCSASGGTKAVFMGGVVGAFQRGNVDDDATISHCHNTGAVSRGTITEKVGNTFVGGVIGALQTVDGTMSIEDLTNTGNVSAPNLASNIKNHDILAISGGLIGAVYGSNFTTAAASIVISDSHVSDCKVENGHWNNTADYDKADHVGGFVGWACGSGISGAQVIVFSDCDVENVAVESRRGYMGGFASWIKGVKVTNCDVLSSYVTSAMGQGFSGGGIAAIAEDVTIENSDVTLTKSYTYSGRTMSLWTRSGGLYTGGVAGWVKGTSEIEECKAFVNNMTQGNTTAGIDATVRGWIAGYCEGTSTTIKNCGMGGTAFDYETKSAIVTLANNGDITDDIICGSSSTGVSIQGTNYYWNGVVTP